MRRNLAQRQAAMKKKLLAARETFRHCAFRPMCVEENAKVDPEFCGRCSERALQERLRRFRFSARKKAGKNA